MSGAKLGIRGPFGNGFSRGEKMLAIAGGVGAAPLLPLARSDCVMTMLLGARTEPELLFVDQLDECTDVLIATDDGTLGLKGFVTTLMDDLNLAAYDRIAVCGPEVMMRAVLAKVEGKGICPGPNLTPPVHEVRHRGLRLVLHRPVGPAGLPTARSFRGCPCKERVRGIPGTASGRKKNL